MLRFFFKSCSALGLALLIYFVIFQQACSQTLFVAANFCDSLSTDSNCVKEDIGWGEVAKDVAEDVAEDVADRFSDREGDTQREPSPPPIPRCRYSYDMSLGKVDIIFVIDNSSSMAEEHASLANQFEDFLTDIQNVDYHIAVITTDVNSQNGEFMPINNQLFLSNPEIGERPRASIITAFQKAVKRQETIDCDQIRNSNPSDSSVDASELDSYFSEDRQSSFDSPCPSWDERGTLALNLAFQNPNYRAFFREDAQMMVVFLSDEDVRSGSFLHGRGGYELEFRDTAESVLQNFYELFHMTQMTKYIRFHSIIIPPGDERCFEKQHENYDQGPGSGRGEYGIEYARLSKPDRSFIKCSRNEAYCSLRGCSGACSLREFLFANNLPGNNLLEGSVISICDRNYGGQLRKVAVSANEMRAPIPCPDPEDLRLYVNREIVRDVEYSTDETKLFIRPEGDLSLSSRIKLEVICVGVEACAND